MSDTIIVRLLADTGEQLRLGIQRLQAVGLEIDWRPIAELEDGQVDGTLRLYDTPDTVAAKAAGARAIIDQVIDPPRYDGAVPLGASTVQHRPGCSALNASGYRRCNCGSDR